MAEPSHAAAQAGLVLGRYRLLRPLGSGGMGSVWHAHDERHGREVALKIVPRTGTAGPRAEREATASTQLKHPACVRAYSLARDEGHVYIAYEYVAGRTLRHAMERGELDDAAAIEVAAQLLDGLAYAHSRGIVHRDVKPSNVLLADGPDLSVRLLDFGLALVTEEETLTAAGDVPGTLAYISPERLTGKTAGPATDVWSVGVVLWETLAGHHPFGAGPFLELAKRIGRGAPSLAAARPDLPKPLVGLVDNALATDPAKRPSPGKLAHNLRHAASARPHHVHVPRRLPKGTEAVAAAGAAALLAGWSTTALPFFPAYWPGGIALVAALLTLAAPRLGLAFALAVPILPLGNIALGLAIAYGILAAAWLALFWARPRAALLFVVGPLLAAIGMLGLLPLAVLAAGGPIRRAAQAVAAVLAAGVVAALTGHDLPFGGATPNLDLGGITGLQAALGQLWTGLDNAHGLMAEAVALAVAAAAIGAFRHRRLWGAALFGSLATALTLLADPEAAALPLVGAAWICTLVLALEPGPVRPLPRFLRRVRRISMRRPRLRAVTES